MTSHVLFADQTHSAHASAGQADKLTPATATTSVVRQFLDVVRAVFADPTATSAQSHPWLNASIRSQMSRRAQRLMRSDY